MIGTVFGSKYKILKKIRENVFEGVDISTQEEVAIKLESVQTDPSKLAHELKMYKHLQGADVGIPSYKDFGEEVGYRFLVIQLLGQSLEDLLKRCGGRFTLKTVLMLAEKIIPIFRHMHSKLVVHRNINPGHLLMGVNSDADKVYPIDFGFANFFVDQESGEHIPYREDVSFVGTLDFAGLQAHFGTEQCRRDDGESLLYVLMYLLKGSLPWQVLTAESNREVSHDVLSRYKYFYTSYEELMKSSYPEEFHKCLKLTRYITFHQIPAFLSMMVILRRLFKREGFEFDFAYDWKTAPAPAPEDDIKLGTSSEKPKRILVDLCFLSNGSTTQDSSCDDQYENMISDDDVSSSKVVSNYPDERVCKSRQLCVVGN